MVSVIITGVYLYLAVCIMQLLDWIEGKIGTRTLLVNQLQFIAIANGLVASIVFALTVYEVMSSWWI